MNYLCKFFLSASASALLVACGGGGGSNTVSPINSGPPPQPPAMGDVSVNGIIAAGLAECDITLQDLDGSELTRDADGSDVTGVYALNIPAQNGVFILSAINCNYEDELTGNIITNGAFRAGLVLEASENDITIQKNISPISEMSLRSAIQRSGGQDLITTSIMTEESNRFSRFFGGENFDPDVTHPIIATDTESDRTDSAGENFGLVLAAISGAGDVETVMSNFIAQLDPNTMEPSDEGIDSILKGALTFEDSGRNAATIPTAQSLAPLTNNGFVSGIAPIFIKDTESISALLDQTISIDLKTFFTDEDSTSIDVVGAGLPESFQISQGILSGKAEVAQNSQLTLTAFDGTGNATSGVIMFKIMTPESDSEAPTVSFAPSEITVESADTGMSVLSAKDNVGITSGPNVSCTNGGMWSDGIFTAPSTTTDMIITCTASASDAEGNVGTAALNVNVTGIAVPPSPPSADTVAPRLAFIPNILTLAPGDSTYSSLQASDNVGVTDGPNVACTNGGMWSDGVFTAPATETDLISVCTATASDAAGNIGSSTLTVNVEASAEDQLAPVLSFSPEELSVDADETASSTLSASDNIAITSGPNVTCTNGGVFENNIFTAPATTTDITSVCNAMASDAAGNTGTATLTVSITGKALPPPSAFETKLDTRGEVSRFLSLAGFGGSSDDLDSLVNTNAEDWLSDQFSKPYVSYLTETDNQISAYAGSNRFNGSHRVIFWDNAISGDDPLRHRMTLALSQIVVASEMVLVNDARRMAYYMNAIGQNAFGNYRQLLEDVTYSPAMGQYLTYLGNKKGNPETGRMPDENYAREILQLFSIGIDELNMDGTRKLRSDGTPIETYTNADIVGLARVFTGLTFGSSGDRYAIPMVMTPQGHSELEKTFLGQTIPAGTLGEASIDQALDIIFEHPNVAPFVSRQLIQRFTSSHPEPAYVERVATAFETGVFVAPDGTRFGTTGRGDLTATLAAILLDPSQHDDPMIIRDTTDIGKVREPILSFIHWARAFEVSPPDSSIEDLLVFGTQNPVRSLGQQAFAAPSVFNFYRPRFIPNGTTAGNRNLTMPEMQLVDGALRTGYIDFMTTYVMGDSIKRTGENENNFLPDFSALIPLVDNSDSLINYLDELLFYGRMTDQTRLNMREVNDNVPIRSGSEAEDRKTRAELAVLIAVTAPEFQIQQ